MLILTRKQDQVIQVGNDIVIRVIHTGRGGVKLGIDAPHDVRILRGELAPHEAAAVDTTEHALAVSGFMQH